MRAHAHRFRIERPITSDEWSAFRAALAGLETLARDGELGAAPDPEFRAERALVQVQQNALSVTVSGMGISAPFADGARRRLGADPLCIDRRMAAGSEVACNTRGRPYDGAIRLVVLLLSAIAPGSIRLEVSGDPSDWITTARVASRILGRSVASPLAPPGWEALPDGSWRLSDDTAEVVVYPVRDGEAWRASVEGAIVFPGMEEGRVGFTGCAQAMLVARATRDSVRPTGEFQAA